MSRPRLALDPRQVKAVAIRARVCGETVRNWLKGIFVQEGNRYLIETAVADLGYHVARPAMAPVAVTPAPAVAPPEPIPMVAIPADSPRLRALLDRARVERDGRPAGGVQT